MSQQPELTSPQPAMSPATKPEPKPVSAPPTESSPGKHAPQRIPPWLESAELFLRTFVLIFIGLVICIAPWSGQLVVNYPRLQYLFPGLREFWDQNPLFVQFPTLGVYAANGAVRGMVSGLGLLNLWIAFHDALRHRGG
jgi:hypothetical protein